ncbi:glycosyltransferase [Bacillus sp. ISL-40]|uniref:glycosyltransferase n=1 Tax=unclassified Bacillus (in: firmicutes) TaxID=185979 RepID=UPI001BE516F0|nr:MULTISPECIES: glycosyltransferase [unclassified Bacillus (in: firmicutes)]MBT2699448.1 glycosyltransferase [Bacillus sp. ISL-40]MBT2721978.1 glycosyltransferase [Bacillus sp. ISL-46]MBT2741673.1 glycosyltransferase [Bacillus sp. ISL-77]
MKKTILFVMNKLICGGAEKSLISLLETIDYSQYEVDLLLFKQEGLFLNKVPKQVNLLEEPFGYKYFDMPIKTAIIDNVTKGRLDIAISRILAGYIFKNEKNKARCEQRVWKYISKSLNTMDKRYDIAIGFLEKNPIYFCVDKVDAEKKIGFIHSDYDMLGMDPKIDKYYFEKLSKIVTVSEESANILKRKFLNLSSKIQVMHNIVAPRVIKKLALESVNKIQSNTITIISVGRLHYAKGYDLAIGACELLIKNGYDIKWFIIGEGEEREKLEQLIKNKGLKKNFILIGMQENPYPYVREADIFVQSSRFEGKSIAIDEAKILQKPIVVTNFNTAKDQITNMVNGIIVDIDSQSIYEGIKTIINDDELKERLKSNLENESLGTESEITKLYEIINK